MLWLFSTGSLQSDRPNKLWVVLALVVVVLFCNKYAKKGGNKKSSKHSERESPQLKLIRELCKNRAQKKLLTHKIAIPLGAKKILNPRKKDTLYVKTKELQKCWKMEPRFFPSSFHYVKTL